MVVKIPILGRAESLNVATSAAICLYERSAEGLTLLTSQRFRNSRASCLSNCVGIIKANTQKESYKE